MTCAKVTVTCTLVTVTGERIVGTNACDNPQPVCPRRLGEGYEKCTTICRQGGHAEVQAVAAAGARARGARAYLQGHTYACRDCQERLFGAGVLSLSVGREPPADCAQPTAKRLLDEFETATHQAARGTSKDIYAREAAREALTAAIEALVEAPREPVACPTCGGSLTTWKCTCDPIWPGYGERSAPSLAQPDNSRCKFAAGGARCASHCGDPICLAATQAPVASGAEVWYSESEHGWWRFGKFFPGESWGNGPFLHDASTGGKS